MDRRTFASPIALHWMSENADVCQLYADRQILDGNAPLNPGADGYNVYPIARSTTYQVYAVKGQTSIPSQSVIVTLYTWKVVKTIPIETVETLAAYSSLALSPDGTVLYYGGWGGVWVIATSSNQVVQTATRPSTISYGGLVVDPSGQTVYAAASGGDVYQLTASNISQANPVVAGLGGAGPLAMSQDGTRLYMASAVEANASILTVIDPRNPTAFTRTYLTGDYANGIGVGGDGGVYIVYITMSGGTMTGNPLLRYNPANATIIPVGGVSHAPLAVAPNKRMLFTGGEARFSIYSGTIQPVALPSDQFQPTIVLANHSPSETVDEICAFACDPDGNVYADLQMQSLYFVETGSGHFTPVMSTAATTGDNSALVVNASGSVIYYANGGTLWVIATNAHGGVSGREASLARGTDPSFANARP